ncbi:MAG: phosphate ABC transporter substrate-binding protein [Oscillospiraceae bacterium]|nr:phosphate ABC transporter substrate-binding protein [Oscillospiraceae bacterium]
MSAARRAVVVSSIFLLLTSCGSARARGVVVAGSTSVQPYAELLAEEYEHLYGGVVDVQGGGSSAGITAALSGAADIGMSSRELKEGEGALRQVEIARDGLAVIVHPSNPVSDLTPEQVRALYAADAVNWKEFGGPDAAIHIIAREEGSGTRSAFEELLMAGRRITPKAIVQNSNGQVTHMVAGDERAIGFISLGLVDGTVKALRLGGAEATRDNVANGTYALFRPFLFVLREDCPEETVRFADFALSAAGQRLLAAEGLVTAEWMKQAAGGRP